MDNGEVLFWTAILRQAKKGNETAIETLKDENELRAEKNLPTVEEELMEIVEEAELTAKIEEIKARKLKQMKKQ